MVSEGTPWVLIIFSLLTNKPSVKMEVFQALLVVLILVIDKTVVEGQIVENSPQGSKISDFFINF